MIRKALLNDLDAIKHLADKNKETLGFVMRPSLLFGIQKGWLFVAENEQGIVGFVHYRHRRDGQTTVYEICVAKDMREQGIGRALINAVAQECQACIQLKAVADLPANDFYEHLGFELVRTEQGKKRALHVWRYDIAGLALLRRGESAPC